MSGGSMDASNILKPFLVNGKLKFVGSTTYEEYKNILKKIGHYLEDFKKLK